MELYWLGRSVPELADLPKKERRRVYFKALQRAPWVLALIVPLVICCFFAGFLPTVLIAADVIGDRGTWWITLLIVLGISGLVAFVPSWIIGRPILFHFVRPQIRLVREADEGQQRSTH
jgi:uncharacterized membrane protein YdbT with pleckstrin-like domain